MIQKKILLQSNGKKPIILEQNKEYNMGDPKTLANFVAEGKRKFPAKETILYIFAHGRGVLNIPVSDGAKFGQKSDIMKLASSPDETSESYFDETTLVHELQKTLGNKPLDLLVLNSCLMGNLEVLNILAPIAKLAVASEFTICVDSKGTTPERSRHRGVSAKKLIEAAVTNPKASTFHISHEIVNEYEAAYQNFIIPTDAEEPEKCATTLAIFDLTKIHSVVEKLNQLENRFLQIALQNTTQKEDQLEKLIQALFRSNYVDSFGYFDLQTFANLIGDEENIIQKSLNQLISKKVDLNTTLDQPASQLSIYLPPPTMVESDFDSFQNHYKQIPALQTFTHLRFIQIIHDYYKTHQYELIRKWVERKLNGEDIRLRSSSNLQYNEYFLYVTAYVSILELKEQKNLPEIQKYLDLIMTTKYSSPDFEKHKAEILQLLR